MITEEEAQKRIKEGRLTEKGYFMLKEAKGIINGK